jgi:hypothetical protein
MKINFTILILLILVLTSFAFSQNQNPSIFDSPHEKDVIRWMNKFPHSFKPLNPPGQNPDFITDFLNLNISNNSFPQNEPSVKISRVDPNRVVAAWRDFRTGVNPALRRVGFSLSTDGGKTWSVSQLLPQIIPGALLSSDPVVGVDLSGNFYIYTVSLNDNNGNGELWVFKSTDQGETFDQVYEIATGPGFEDKEWATTDLNPLSPFSNNLYCSWTRFSAGTEILLIRSIDEGVTWSSPVSVSDGQGVQGSFPAVGPNGELYVVWHNYNNSGQMMFDKSTDGGVTFGIDKVVSSAPNAWFPHMAVDLSGGPRHGYIYVTWNDERNSDDDAFLSYSSDDGDTWSPATRLNNDPVGNGKLQYWPSIAVSELSEISIIFYDTRNTPNNNFIEAYLARSADGGLTFTNELISTEPSPTSIPNGDVRFGDYINIDAYGGNIIPVWTDERAGSVDMDIYTAVINPIVPVELTSFTAKINKGNTILEWSTATETNNFGFEVERKFDNQDWITIGFIQGHGTTTSIQNYFFTDKGRGTKIYYRLKQIDYNSKFKYSDIIEVNSVSVITIDLEQNYPNPFNPSTKIKYQVADPGYVSLKVYNTLGEEVNVLVNNFKPAGSYEIDFNATDLSGGIYIYQLISGDYKISRKMILLK